MTESDTPYVCELRNKIEALVRCQRGALSELARYLKRKPQNVSAWVTLRKRLPNGEITLRMQQWVAAKTLQLAISGKTEAQAAYRAAFLRVCEEHPISREIPADGKQQEAE